MSHAWVWVALFALGCYHGINPGMGWLFAVAMGLQEKSLRAVFAALPPILIGHLASVAAFVAIVGVAQRALPQNDLRYGAAGVLLAFGVLRLVRARHIRWVGMRVGFSGLVTWSFLMATGHGAGLMLLPFLTGSVRPTNDGMHMGMGQGLSIPALPPAQWPLAIAVHTFGYLLIMTAAAWLVYDRTGVGILKATWFNFDLIWALALILSGLLILVL